MGGCVVVALLIYFLVVSPYIKAMELMDRRISSKTEELKEVLGLQQEYLRLKEKTRDLEELVRSSPGFSLLSFLENLATRNKIKQQIAYMKPVTTPAHEKYRESSVEMKLEGLTLQQLVDYIYGIEHSGQRIRIKRLNLVKKKEQGYLNVTLQASTFEPVAGGVGAQSSRTAKP
jgi:hypothetical protein